MLAITQVPSAADRGVGGSVRTPWGKLPACPNSVPKLAASATIVRFERVLLLMATFWVIGPTARAQEASPVDFEPELEQIDAPSLSTINESIDRGIDFLLEDQNENGSWGSATRCRGSSRRPSSSSAGRTPPSSTSTPRRSAR